MEVVLSEYVTIDLRILVMGHMLRKYLKIKKNIAKNDPNTHLSL